MSSPPPAQRRAMEINRARLLAYVNGDVTPYESEHSVFVMGQGDTNASTVKTINHGLLRHDIHVLLHTTRTSEKEPK